MRELGLARWLPERVRTAVFFCRSATNTLRFAVILLRWNATALFKITMKFDDGTSVTTPFVKPLQVYRNSLWLAAIPLPEVLLPEK